MKLRIPQPAKFGVKQSLLALALMAAYASASALPVFTLNPGAAGLNGSSITGDNIIVSDYSSVNITGTTFTNNGFLNVQNFQLGNDPFSPAAGLNSNYGLYVKFTSAGTQGAGNPMTDFTHGTFTSLDYTLYGYNGGPAAFTFDSSNVAHIATASTPIALATGSLIQGGVQSQPLSGSFVPSAAATLTFAPVNTGFFMSPSPFYNVALTSFTNTVSQVNAFDGGFTIRQGGGSINFTSPIPEPETYALMLAGLGAIGWISRRRRKI